MDRLKMATITFITGRVHTLSVRIFKVQQTLCRRQF